MTGLDLTELTDLLRSPFTHEDLWDTLPLVVADLDPIPTGPDDGWRPELRQRLLDLPAVTVARVGGPVAPRDADLVGAFDIVFAPPDQAGSAAVPTEDPVAEATVAARVAERPQAAVALCQLLRLSAGADVSAALAAESFVYSTLQGGPEFATWLAGRREVAPDADESPPVRVDRRASTLVLTLDRPDRRNAFSARMRDALVDGLRVAAADASLDGVVLAGEGPAFCAGGDLTEFGTTPDPTTAHMIRSVRSPGYWLDRLGGRVRCHLHGACVGAGIELPAFTPTIVAAPDTTVALPEVGMGLVPGAGGTVSIPRRIGRHRTAWLAITGETIDATTALGWGLVDRIEEPDRSGTASNDPGRSIKN